MKNSEKFSKFESITVQSVIDWLDGCAVSCVATQRNLDSIDYQYCYSKICYTVFRKEHYDGVYLSNAKWMDGTKPFVSEFERKRNKYWPSVSKNLIRKCRDTDDMVRAIVRVLSPYINFRIHGESHYYIRIRSILSENGDSVYVHDKSGDICRLRSDIREMEVKVKSLKSKLGRLEAYQSVYEGLHGSPR